MIVYLASAQSLVKVQLLDIKSNINNYTAYSACKMCLKPDLTNKQHLILIEICNVLCHFYLCFPIICSAIYPSRMF